MSTVSIIPGIENFGAGADRDQQRVGAVAEPPAEPLLDAPEVLLDLGVELGRLLAVLSQYRHASVSTVKPGGTGRPRFVISARFAPLPPSRSRCSLEPSAKSWT